MAGASIDFAAGAVIFRAGEPGGDLYFIREGEVEVYREAKGLDVRLAVLKAGEVLGIMTCLTREPRLASARALTPVKGLLVKQAGIRSLISTTPAWVHTVIKDFTLRIKHMDELYTRACQRLEAQELQVSSVKLAVAVARGLGEIGGLTATAVGDTQVVDVDAALAKLGCILDVQAGRLDQVFAIFIASGLLKGEREARSRKASLGVLERLGAFADVASKYLASADVRQKLGDLTPADRSYLGAVVEAMKEQRQTFMTECTLPMSRLAIPSVPAEVATESLRRAAAAGLMRLEESPSEMLVTFVPAYVGTVVHTLLAIDALHQFDRSSTSRVERSLAAVLT